MATGHVKRHRRWNFPDTRRSRAHIWPEYANYSGRHAEVPARITKERGREASQHAVERFLRGERIHPQTRAAGKDVELNAF